MQNNQFVFEDPLNLEINTIAKPISEPTCLAPPFLTSEMLCEESARELVWHLNEAKASVIAVSENTQLDESERLLVLDTAANVSNRLQEIIESKMRRLVRDEPLPPDDQLVEIAEEQLEGSDVCRYSLFSAVFILSRARMELMDGFPRYDLDVDDKGNIIVDWNLQHHSLEWTIMKSNAPWPTVKVYEFHQNLAEKNEGAKVRSWHNIRSLVQRLRSLTTTGL